LGGRIVNQQKKTESTGSMASDLLKSIQGSVGLDLPEELKNTDKTEKSETEKRARDLADAIA
jgi:hypothetical protein